MKYKEYIRRKNLNKIAISMGSWLKLSNTIKMSHGYISDIKNGNRPFSDRIANVIELKLELPHGSLDIDDGIPDDTSELIYIPEYKTQSLNTIDSEIITPDNIIGHTPIIKSEIKKTNLQKQDLLIITINDDHMSPTCINNDKILIDTSKKEIIDNKIFAIYHNNIVLVRRLFIDQVTGKVLLKSDNLKNNQVFNFELNPQDKIIGLAINTLGRKLF